MSVLSSDIINTRNIPNKTQHSFICFDIIDFYPSITEELLHKALDFASQYTPITDDEWHIMLNSAA